MKSSGKRIKLNVDTPLLVAVVLLVFIGILTIYSANIKKPEFHSKYIKQIIAALIGVLIFVVFLYTEYHRFTQMWIFFFGASIVMLLLTLLFARRIHGSKSWIFIFGQGFQPSEFVKLFTIIAFAYYLDRIKKRIREFKFFLLCLLFVAPPIGLILLQPDFGTAVVFFPFVLVMMFIAGADKKHIFSFLGIVFIGLGIPLINFYVGDILNSTTNPILALRKSSVTLLVAIVFAVLSGILYLVHRHFKEKMIHVIMLVTLTLSVGFTFSIGVKSFLKRHHYQRFLVFIDKDRIDPRGSGWNISQSLTAIGAGGFRGQGFLAGNQKNGGFLPAQDTDFIFAVIAEEWGFIGSLVIMILFMIILYRGVNVIFNAKDMIGSLIAAGIVSMLFFHIMINIGMTVGIMPVMGLPLPLLSYGGSFLITCLGSIGLLLNIELRKYVY